LAANLLWGLEAREEWVRDADEDFLRGVGVLGYEGVGFIGGGFGGALQEEVACVEFEQAGEAGVGLALGMI
jgi:hypothetical protein